MKLKEVFDKQRELNQKIQVKERSLGYSPPAPEEMNLLIRSHQDWMRTLSWFFVEEVGEFLLASTPDDQRAELSDCLHFIVEIAIFSGLDHTCLDSHRSIFNFSDVPEPAELDEATLYLAQAINLLKMKPWRETPQDMLDLGLFQYLVSKSLYTVILACEFQGWDFHEIYMNKNQINVERTENGY